MSDCPPNIKKYMKICFNKITTEDWDNVVVITGDVGRGKSNLALWMVDEWFRLQDRITFKMNIRDYMAMTAQDFAENIAKVKQFDIVVHDEAGDISSRTAMNKVNVMFMKAYQVIRGANLFTILCIPSIWYLDSYFRGTRVRHMFYVNKRVGVRYATYRYWSKTPYRKMLEKFRRTNAQPDTYDNSYDMEGQFSQYDGVFADAYKLMKSKKIAMCREELPSLIGSVTQKTKVNERKGRIVRMLSEGMSVQKIAQLEDVSVRTIQNYKRSNEFESSSNNTGVDA